MEALKAADPRLIGDVRIRARLGQGGMGRVFFGVTRDDEPVAVKVIRDVALSGAGHRARFEREIEALRMVQSPRIAGLVAAVAPEEESPWLRTRPTSSGRPGGTARCSSSRPPAPATPWSSHGTAPAARSSEPEDIARAYRVRCSRRPVPAILKTVRFDGRPA